MPRKRHFLWVIAWIVSSLMLWPNNPHPSSVGLSSCPWPPALSAIRQRCGKWRDKRGGAWTSGTTFWWVSNYTTWPWTDGIGPRGSAAWLHLINSSIYILTINVVFCCSLNGSHHRPHANTTQRGISCYDCHAETTVIKPECTELAHALASRLSFRVQTLI